MPRRMRSVSVQGGETVQVAAQVHPGLRAAVENACREQGLNLSTIVRRALMADLGVDSQGVPVVARRPRGARA